MNGTIRVGNLFGIPFYVHPSWFFVFALVTWQYGSQLGFLFPGLGVGLPWILGLVAALLLFSSVLAHELGHSFAAIRQGIDVKSINLFLFGGLANLEKESDTPAEAFWVAIAGPLVSLLLFSLFTGIGVYTSISGPIAAILALLAQINLALALFNLIPGLPLDGGNILKAIVWKITGNPYKGMIFAGRAGQIVGGIAIATGLLPAIAFNSGINFWSLFIGWFLLQNAGQSVRYGMVQNTLSGLTAEDAVMPNSPIISSALTLREFANEYVIGKENWHKFLVTDAEGYLVGAIAIDDLKTIPVDSWPHTQVLDLVKPVDPATIIKSDESLLDVVTTIEQKQLFQLPVVRDNGMLVGLLEKTSIIDLMQRKAEAKTA